MCDVRTITHREMRNDSGKILRAVAAGETLQVTNLGQVAAVISPPGEDPLVALETVGQLRPPRRPLSDVATISRRPATTSTREILRDLRGPW